MNIFTKDGFDLIKTLIAEKEKKVKNLGVSVGKAAGENCDWHDNFDYEESKRILELEKSELDKLVFSIKDAQIVEIQDVEQDKKISIGSSVLVSIDEEEKEYVIGAYGESYPKENLISYSSPLGQQLMNMKKDEKKEIALGNKQVEIKIIKIFPPSYKYEDLIKKIRNG